MRLACIMMQKDEDVLIEPWIRYHEWLVGGENLYVLDNGSRSSKVHECLQSAQQRGVNVLYEHSRKQDFFDKGAIITDLIKRLDSENGYDFYFPMDSDEFLASEEDFPPACDSRALEMALRPYLGSANVLVVKHKYGANPLRRNHYSLFTSSKKCFFAGQACEFLDHGYHRARSRSGAGELIAPIVYFEFHYRPYRQHVLASKRKLKGLVSDFSRHTLKAYAQSRRDGFHCAIDLLKSEYDYLVSLASERDLIALPVLLETFHHLDISYDRLYQSEAFWRLAPYRTLLRLRASLQRWLDPILHPLRRRMGRLRSLCVRVVRNGS